jgi:hypothetical protein
MEMAKKALLDLEYDDLKRVFNSLMTTDRIFWDLLSYVEERDKQTAINYLTDKLLNDCTAKEILGEI